MKRLFSIILGIAVAAASLSAQVDTRQISELASKLATNRISLNYKCTVAGQTPVKLSGTLLIQGQSYLAKGNGMEIYCNGKTRWTVDRESKEVYIEDAEGLEELYQYKDSLSDLKLTDIKYLAIVKDSGEFTFNTAALDSSWVVTDLR